jgi:hypothetical protein
VSRGGEDRTEVTSVTDSSRHSPPTEDGAVVVLPDVGDLPGLVRANAERVAAWDFAVSGTPAAELARQVRAELLDLAAEYTASLGVEPPEPAGPLLVATGHQPELFHAGIWLKNHLAGRIARAVGGTCVNFIVDNDVVDVSRIKVLAKDRGELKAASVPFLDAPRGRAAEEVTVPDGAVEALREAARRAETALPRTMAGAFAAKAEPDRSLPRFVARPRRRLEETFGLRNLELPVSRLAGTAGFRRFCAHLLDHAGRFVDLHNRVLDRHRGRHRITNPVEPVPNLSKDDGRIEVPFWFWEAGGPRRPMRLRPGETPDPAALRDPRRKVRPRALAMTLFFRLFCCDLFVHGMGGARYEPINDGILREFFGVEPPAYAAASATRFLKPDCPVPSDNDVTEIHQRVRRMKSTPERFVDELLLDDPEARELADRRRALRHPTGGTKRERRRAYDESKKIADRLQQRLRPHILDAERTLERADALRRAVADREVPFFLHPRSALEELYAFPALESTTPRA